MKIATKLIFALSVVIANSSFTMSTLAKRLKISSFSNTVGIRCLKTLETKPVTLSDWRTLVDMLHHGIDSTTLKTIKEIQTSLEAIRTGCYCADEADATKSRQKKLLLTSNILKRLAAQTKRKNCDLNSEIYKKN